MHAVSLTPHAFAKYDTACTIDERFERPWQPLQGISIKNIYSTSMFPNSPTPPLKDTACTTFAFENRSYLGEFEAEFQKALDRESGAQGVLFDEKTEGLKFRDTVPLKIPIPRISSCISKLL
jgi:hypothetical protein